MKNAVYRFPELQKNVGLSRSTIWRLERESKFPSHIQLSTHTVGWEVKAVEKWIESRRASTNSKVV